MLLEGKVAIITGAGSGIGNGIAKRFAKEGCAVALADIDRAAAKKAVGDIEREGGRAAAIECDVTQEAHINDAVEKTVAALGPVGIMVNNAGAAGVTKPTF